MSQLHLTTWQRSQLRRQLTGARDARLYRRTLAVLEFDRGRSVANLAEMLGVARQSIYNWVAAYTTAHDPTVLADAERSGRPPLLTEDIEGRLRQLLDCSPQDLDYPATTWTVPLLQEQLQRETGQRPSDDTIRRKLHRLDYVWKRPRYILDPDPELRGKKETPLPADQAVAAAKRGAGRGRDRSVVVSAVESGLGTARRTQAGTGVRSQRSPDDLRSSEPAHRSPAVSGTGAPASR
jgi:transposase